MFSIFNFFGAVSVISGLALAVSLGVESMGIDPPFAIRGGELTITFSVLDRVLLVIFLLALLLGCQFWLNAKGRSGRGR